MKTLATLFLTLLCALTATLCTAAEVPYDAAKFAAARQAGQSVAVVFHADWCPTCRAQAPVLKDLAQTKEFQSLTVYVANFDTEKDLKRALSVTRQSTIVVFKGGRETARSTGETQKPALAEFLRAAIG